MIERITLTRRPDPTTGHQGAWTADVEFSEDDPRAKDYNATEPYEGLTPQAALDRALHRVDALVKSDG